MIIYVGIRQDTIIERNFTYTHPCVEEDKTVVIYMPCKEQDCRRVVGTPSL
jgi:hypothetical protein